MARRFATRTELQILYRCSLMPVVRECRQLKRDVGSFHENNKFGASFQLELSFAEDIAASEHANERLGFLAAGRDQKCMRKDDRERCNEAQAVESGKMSGIRQLLLPTQGNVTRIFAESCAGSPTWLS